MYFCHCLTSGSGCLLKLSPKQENKENQPNSEPSTDGWHLQAIALVVAALCQATLISTAANHQGTCAHYSLRLPTEWEENVIHLIEHSIHVRV